MTNKNDWEKENYLDCEPFAAFYFNKETFAGHQPSLLPRDVYDFVRAEKSKSYSEALTRAEEILEKMKQEFGESEGWDVFSSDAPRCCPGDDIAEGYQLALSQAQEKLKEIKTNQ